MLIAMFWMVNTAGTSDIPTLMQYDFAPEAQTWLWLSRQFRREDADVPVYVASAAHVQAPTAGSVILAGVLLKLGGYGFIRFSLPMFPEASAQFVWLVLILSCIAVVYASLVALVQQDMKKLIAYSSVAHMAIVTAGLFAFNVQGLEGAMIMMLSHGLVSGALFLCVGIIYDRLHTREISRYGGLAINMPRYALFFLLFTMASIGLPGTSGFVAEFISLAGVYEISSDVTLILTTGIILGAGYMLYLYRRVVFGTQVNEDAAAMSDMNAREWVMLAPIAAAVLWMGIYPESFIAPMRSDIAALEARVARAAPQGDAKLQAGEPRANAQLFPYEHAEGESIDIMQSLGLMASELLLSSAAMLLLLVVAYGGRSTARLVFILAASALGAALFFVVPTVTEGTAGAGAMAFLTQFSADAFAAFAKP